VGVALLYRALAIGRMAVVAPVTAVCAVVVPVAFAMAFGERPGTQAGLGMLLALLAIVLVTRQEPPASGSTASRSGLDLALASGVVIGLFFLALARTSGQAGLWPLVAARLVSVTLFTLLAVLSRRALTMKGTTMWLAVGGGVVDMLANLLYLLASRQGPLTLVVTLTSLYPASTVLLARVVLNERISPHQWLGITCALIAIITIVTA
jgi:drug/metabolite transporter (DMT)-like permease